MDDAQVQGAKSGGMSADVAITSGLALRRSPSGRPWSAKIIVNIKDRHLKEWRISSTTPMSGNLPQASIADQSFKVAPQVADLIGMSHDDTGLDVSVLGGFREVGGGDQRGLGIYNHHLGVHDACLLPALLFEDSWIMPKLGLPGSGPEIVEEIRLETVRYDWQWFGRMLPLVGEIHNESHLEVWIRIELRRQRCEQVSALIENVAC